MSQFDWILKDFHTTRFTAFDTETTGLEPRTNRIVEVGGIRFDSRGASARFNTLIDPGVPMPAEVTKINGITDTMLKGQPSTSVAMQDFLRFIGKTVLVAHNAPFDVNFVNEELKRTGLPTLSNRVIDTRIFAREMFPGLPKYALQDLALRFGIKAIDAHRAEDDARVCMELFRVCVGELANRSGISTGGEPSAPKDNAADDGINTAIKPRDDKESDLFDDTDEYEDDFTEEAPD